MINKSYRKGRADKSMIFTVNRYLKLGDLVF